MTNGNRFGPREAMPLDQFINEAGSIIDELFPKTGDSDEFARLVKVQTEEIRRVRAAAARIFDTEDGRLVLEALCDSTLRRPTFITHVNMPADRGYAFGCFREGMNAAVFAILRAIAEGRDEPPPQREGL